MGVPKREFGNEDGNNSLRNSAANQLKTVREQVSRNVRMAAD
jgi:hypothetical protein